VTKAPRQSVGASAGGKSPFSTLMSARVLSTHVLFIHPGGLFAGIGRTAAVVQTAAKRRMMIQPTSLALVPLASLAAQGTLAVVSNMLIGLSQRRKPLNAPVGFDIFMMRAHLFVPVCKTTCHLECMLTACGWHVLACQIVASLAASPAHVASASWICL